MEEGKGERGSGPGGLKGGVYKTMEGYERTLQTIHYVFSYIVCSVHGCDRPLYIHLLQFIVQ